MTHALIPVEELILVLNFLDLLRCMAIASVICFLMNIRCQPSIWEINERCRSIDGVRPQLSLEIIEKIPHILFQELFILLHHNVCDKHSRASGMLWLMALWNPLRAPACIQVTCNRLRSPENFPLNVVIISLMMSVMAFILSALILKTNKEYIM